MWVDPWVRAAASGVSATGASLPRVRQERVGPFRALVPQTRHERARGLLGRRAIGSDEGLLLRRCRSVHTFGMRFAIDAVLLDRTWRVIGVVRLVPGRVLLPRPRVRHVLEVAPGAGPPRGARLIPRPVAPA